MITSLSDNNANMEREPYINVAFFMQFSLTLLYSDKQPMCIFNWLVVVGRTLPPPPPPYPIKGVYKVIGRIKKILCCLSRGSFQKKDQAGWWAS